MLLLISGHLKLATCSFTFVMDCKSLLRGEGMAELSLEDAWGGPSCHHPGIQVYPEVVLSNFLYRTPDLYLLGLMSQSREWAPESLSDRMAE